MSRPRALDVMSWNVLADAYVRAEYYPYSDAALLAPGARTAAILARISDRDAAVVCLQEVEPALVGALEATFGARYAVCFAPKRGRPDGVAMLVRRELDLAGTRELVFADGRGAEDSGHVALIAEIEGVTVATTHLRWDPPGTPRELRWAVAQADELAALARGPGACVVCGDLNLADDDPVLASLAAAGLCDAYAAAPSPTANANGRAKRIDYLLYTPSLSAIPAPLPAIDDTTPLPSAEEPSDHLAIAARFTWRT
jgi:CCR4-NOT transcription complex subunit 6